MKKAFAIILASFLLSNLSSFAQDLLFENFTDATIRFVNRSKITKKINFDIVDQKVLYLDGETVMEMVNPRLIDTVFVDGRKFVCKNDLICEYFANDNGGILVNWKIKNVNVGSKGAYGMPTQGKVEVLRALDFDVPYTITNWGNVGSQGSNSMDLFRRSAQNTYFFKAGGIECKATRLADIYKAFPDKKSQIKAFAKEKGLNLKTTEEAFKVIEFIYSLYSSNH